MSWPSASAPGCRGCPIAALVIAVAAQAFVVTQIGLRAGVRAGEGLRHASERLAGLALIAMGAGFLLARLT